MSVHLPARRVTDGIVRGRIAKSSVPISFLGELDANTGRIDNPKSELNNRVVTGLILAFPEAIGSTVGPYVLYGAKKQGVGPKGIIVNHADAIVASAAVLAGIPCVAGVDMENLVEGEEVTLDATDGFVDVPGVVGCDVVTAFLQAPDGEILLLKRSEKVGSFKGFWAGISGFVEKGISPMEQARVEIREESGLGSGDVTLAREGRPIYVRDGKTVFVVHPFLFRTLRKDIALDWEHTESKWMPPKGMKDMNIVPGLDRAWHALTSP